MRSALDLLVFPNSMFTSFYVCKGYVLSGEIALVNNHCNYYYYYLQVALIFPNQHMILIYVIVQAENGAYSQ